MRCSLYGFLTERLKSTLPHSQIHANAGHQLCLIVALSQRDKVVFAETCHSTWRFQPRADPPATPRTAVRVPEVHFALPARHKSQHCDERTQGNPARGPADELLWVDLG